MKTIGLLGGMSWESSLEYYRIINETVKQKLGGLHSADSLMYSFDFHEIEQLQMAGDWDTATARMVEAAQQLERGGAALLVICTNTMHKMAEAVQASIDIPLLHIADATAEKIIEQGLQTVGLLGTRFTMEEDFYKGRLEQYGLNVLVPDAAGRAVVHDIIYDELVLGTVKPASKAQYQTIIQQLVEQGAEGIILGCTEIMLLIQQDDSPVPVFDTTTIHAVTAVERALEGITL
ncbi:MAG: aspartate/glutamate racemase family protein [Anaerolineae bacterium]|nr:aspartate/glutamate racemase family protein [Anaerolineae bacterium]